MKQVLSTEVKPEISIVVPVYNESATILETIKRVRSALANCVIEIIVVDDGSYDGTTELVRDLESLGEIQAFFHDSNQGKGASLRTAFGQARGKIVVIQDADLEYDPIDIPRLIRPIQENKADVVYGCRFHGEAQRVHLFWHRVANTLLTMLSNMLTNLNLSDMETGYKSFRADVISKLIIHEGRFGVEPELTAKIARLKCRIYEVPVSYNGRDYTAGKKIGLRDALWAVWCIIRYRFSD